MLSLEVRSAGYSIVTFMNFIMTFVVGQYFLSMLCAFRVSPRRPSVVPANPCRHARLSGRCVRALAAA